MPKPDKPEWDYMQSKRLRLYEERPILRHIRRLLKKINRAAPR